MAKKPLENEAFYREVDEELRKEQLNETFRRYGWLFIGGVVLLLAAVGGWIYWQHQRDVRAGEQAAELVGLLEDLESGRTEGAAERVDALAGASAPGYRAAALFTRANMALEEGDESAAAAALGDIAADTGLPEPYRQAALVRQTAIQYDDLPPAEVIQRLGPLAQPGGAWLGSAGEMVAIAHMRQERPDLAGPIFAAIARDEQVPQTIRSRAVQMAGALGIDAVAETPETGAPTADEGNSQ